jgi:hypothetical protein
MVNRSIVALLLSGLLAAPVLAVETPSENPPPAKPPKEASVPPVSYVKTGDPVTDVLILLDLYEKGKISKDQFEREKELALQKLP